MITNLFNYNSIQTKLLWGILSVALLVSIGSFILIALNQSDRLNNELEDNLSVLSDIVGEYSVTTLLFDDKSGAEDVLKKISAVPYITEAHLYDSLGVLFASYPAEKSDFASVSISSSKITDTIFVFKNSTIRTKKIIYRQMNYGFIQLIADRTFIKAKIKSLMIYLLMLFIIIIFISYFLARWIHKPLTHPIVQLSAIIRKMTETDDYKVKTDYKSTDEIGELYRGLEVMTQKIESQREKQAIAELTLSRLNEDLEESVNRRTILLEAAIEQLKVEIEEREKTSNELMITKDELAAALKLEKELSDIKIRFVNMISHEYRTPLTIIMSSLALLEKNSIPTDVQRFESHKEKIQSSINRMLEMLNDVLTLGKVQDSRFVLKIERVNVIEIMNTLLNEVKISFSRDHKIEFRNEESEIIIETDTGSFSHVFRNLLSNAFKYSPDFSTISIDAKIANDDFVLVISDCGIGISKEIQEKMFQPFNRGENTMGIQGTGLGLSIVKKYLDEIGGTILFESEAGKGTKFTVVLPIIYQA